jgi:hypothetical protein
MRLSWVVDQRIGCLGMFLRIDFIHEEKSQARPVIVRTITDVSINLQTAKRRALKLLADMRQLGATAFVINRGDGTQLYRWRPDDKIK